MIALTACSRKKDTFLNKKFHAVSTEYNTLFNGNNAFLQGKEALAQTYRDDFYQILPVERIEAVDPDGFDTDSKDPNFNTAEEKAVTELKAMLNAQAEELTELKSQAASEGVKRVTTTKVIPQVDLSKLSTEDRVKALFNKFNS